MNAIQAFIIGIIGIAVLLAIGLIVLQEVQTTQESTPDNIIVTNETLTTVLSGTTRDLAYDNIINSTFQVYNATGILLGMNNYTLYPANGSIFWIVDIDKSYNNTNLNVSYHATNTSTVRTTAGIAVGAVVTNLSKIPTWIGIIVVVALAFIILSFFYGRSQGQ